VPKVAKRNALGHLVSDYQAQSHSTGNIQEGGEKGDTTIVLFYAYKKVPFTHGEQTRAIKRLYEFLKAQGCTGRLRIGREGYNATLTGTYQTIRNFTAELAKMDPETFGNNKIDFKYIDYLPAKQLLPKLKVFAVSEIVTYGLTEKEAPMHMGGVHLKPEDFHKKLEDPNTVVIDVRNFNEALIGKFNPPGAKYIDPCMRVSTEFPQWVQDNRKDWEHKDVMLYCTAGVRCERASAYMRNEGIDNVFQLQGGIHRYLDAFPENGGYWKGKNYTFDKRFAHGAPNAEVISKCVVCEEPWERYQAKKKCIRCRMEVLVCKPCDRKKPAVDKKKLFCPLCSGKNWT
jgi:predicted sulfurtransferase